MRRLKTPLAAGVLLLCLSTLAGTLADGTVKKLSTEIEAPQVFFLSGLIMAALSYVSARARANVSGQRSCLHSSVPLLLFWRCVATVAASLGFFYAVALIPLAEVFLFVGMMPLMSALLSRRMLGEPVHMGDWLGLGIGVLGIGMLFPEGFSGLTFGHVAGFVGALSGTVSLVLSRMIARREMNALVQVFYPNLALALVAMLLLPQVWQPMDMLMTGQIFLYSGLLFLARWAMVLVMQRLRAPVALPLMNIQFVWMVGIGWYFFGEVPAVATVIGAGLVMAAGVIALGEQARAERVAARARPRAIPAE
jgi:drug/metabolite transporter (DMT)-like permease